MGKSQTYKKIVKNLFTNAILYDIIIYVIFIDKRVDK